MFIIGVWIINVHTKEVPLYIHWIIGALQNLMFYIRINTIFMGLTSIENSIVHLDM